MTITRTGDEIKATLKALSLPADDLAVTCFDRGNDPKGKSWRVPFVNWLAYFRAGTEEPWTDATDVTDALLRIEAELKGDEAARKLKDLMAASKLSLPAEYGGTLAGDYRKADNVMTVSRLFLDLDGIAPADATKLRELLVDLKLNYCLVESATSRMTTINGNKNPLKLHGYIQIKEVAFPQRKGGVTTAVLNKWWGDNYVAVAHAITAAAGIDATVVKVDEKVKDPSRQSYVPHVPPRWDGTTRGFYPRENVVGGLQLDFEALALWLGGEPMPAAAAEPPAASAATSRATSSNVPAPVHCPASGPTPGHTNSSLLQLAFEIFGKQGLRLRKGWFERLDKARAERRNPLTAADFGPVRNYFRGGDKDGWRNVYCPWAAESGGDGAASSTSFSTSDAEGSGFKCQHSSCAAAASGEVGTADVLRLARYVCLLTGEHFPERDGGEEEERASDLVTLKKGKKDEPCVDVDDEENATKIFAALAQMNRDHAVARIGGKVGVLWTRDDTFMGKEAFFDWYSNKPVMLTDENGDDKAVNRAALWWTCKRRREYDAVAFRPELTQAAAAAGGIYNLWKGYSVARNPDGDCSLYIEHVFENICNRDHEFFDFVIGWAAHLIQRPDKRLGVGLVLMSKAEGTGKNVFAEALGRLLGNAYRLATQARQITGNFNKDLEHTLLLHAAEAVWAANRSDEGIFKSLVTDATIPIERKGGERYQAKNYLHFIVSSNEDFVVPVSATGRRWAVFKVSEAHMQDRPYFAAIADQLENGGYGKLLDILLNVDLATVDLSKIPNTEALVAQKMHSMPALDRWLMEACSHNSIPGSKRVVSVIKETQRTGSVVVESEVSSKMLDRTPWPDDEQIEVGRPELFDAYATWCSRNRMQPPNENTFSKPLRELFDLGSQRGIYWLPPLSRVRQVMATKYGMVVTTETAAPPAASVRNPMAVMRN